mgnify:CR=1 FL=1
MGAMMKSGASPGLMLPGWNEPDDEEQVAAPVPPPMMMPPPQAPAPPQQMAMQGLQEAIQAPPGPGWADDPAMMATAQGLGDRVQGTPMDTLRRVFQKQGRVY